MKNLKVISLIIGLAFLIVTVVMFSLIRKGGALKPAGVIKPAAIGTDPTYIGHQVAVRLYPDFHAAKQVIWRLENDDERLAQIPGVAFAQYGNPIKPRLLDLRADLNQGCEGTCWYIVGLNQELPDSIRSQSDSTVEVYIQYFEREEAVPEACEEQKILSVECMRPISVREVRRKIKSAAPHFFMQRYQQSQFYLFIERSR